MTPTLSRCGDRNRILLFVKFVIPPSEVVLGTRRKVIKLGGSALFSGSSWIPSLSRLLKEESDARVYVIVGGGDIVEGVRTLHRHAPSLDEEFLHWECVRLLDSTFEIAPKLLPLDGVIHDIANDNFIELRTEDQGSSGAFWVRVGGFYSKELLDTIPVKYRPAHNWDTTTDALAVLLGIQVNAVEVILLKSCELDPSLTLAEAAAQGIVDPECPRLQGLFPGRVRLMQLSN
jgi:5-(aminomethyl)-3-furanmethanol phosphate kinase